MPVYFNGRLVITPTTTSRVDDSALANLNPAIGNTLCLIGECEGGVPGQLVAIGNPDEATRLLRSGDLMLAVRRAFSPSSQTNAAQKVFAVRVNPGTQSALTLKDASAVDAILLKSVGYGPFTNRIMVKVEPGSVSGKRITVNLDGNLAARDNLSRALFTVGYTGAMASASVVVTNTNLLLQAPTGTTVSTLSLSSYDTVQKAVDAINTVAGWTATALQPFSRHPTLNAVDGGSFTAKVDPYNPLVGLATVRGDLQAAVDFLNSLSGLLIATRGASATLKPPANLVYTSMAGATGGASTNANWADAIAKCAEGDAQWLAPLSTDAAVHAMMEAHCSFYSSIGRERRAFVGGPVGLTATQVMDRARNLNCDRIGLVHGGYHFFDEVGALVLFPPYMTAALMAAGFAGLSVGQTMSNKSLAVNGLEFKLRVPTDTDDLLEAGVIPIEDTGTRYRVVQAKSTWLNNRHYNRVEVSTGAGYDFLARAIREAINPLLGEIISPQLLSRHAAIVESVCTELARPSPGGIGLLVGDATSPPFKNIVVTGEGDVVRINFQASVGIPSNYNLVTIFAVPYSGTVSR